MPNRYVRSNAIESEAVNALSWQAEVFYRRLINRVDDFGRFTANPSLLRASLFPLQLDRVRDSDMSRLLTECEKPGLLYVYSADQKQFLVLNKWERGRAKESDYPPPPADICERMKTYVYTRKQMSAHAPDSDSDTDSDISLSIEEIRQAYPLRVKKIEAVKAIKKAITRGATVAHLLDRTKAYAGAVALWDEEDRKFVPHPASWFNSGGFDDDPATWVRKNSKPKVAVGSSYTLLE